MRTGFMHRARDRVCWKTVVNTVMNFIERMTFYSQLSDSQLLKKDPGWCSQYYIEHCAELSACLHGIIGNLTCKKAKLVSRSLNSCEMQ
jgi:hypothetical protein